MRKDFSPHAISSWVTDQEAEILIKDRLISSGGIGPLDTHPRPVATHAGTAQARSTGAGRSGSRGSCAVNYRLRSAPIVFSIKPATTVPYKTMASMASLGLRLGLADVASLITLVGGPLVRPAWR
jgi:hypothetical protein